MSSEMPEGWREAPFSELARYENGRAFKPEDWGTVGLPIVRIAQITKPDAATNRYGGEVDSRHLLNDGDLIFSWSATLAVMKWQRGPAVLNQHLFKVTPATAVDQDWLQFRLEASIPDLTEEAHGTTMKHIRKGTLSSQATLVPPLDEQRRIAEVLRSASAVSEAAHSVVEKYGDVIKAEIDSVVAELIADSSVPVVRISDVATVKGGKRLPKGCDYSENPTGFRYIRVTDWNDHEIDPSNVRWISGEAASAIRRYTISSADLFISIAGSIGLVATVPSELDGAFLTENAAKIVLREDVEVDRDYLLCVMISSWLIGQIQQQKGVGGGVPKLALFRIEALEVPLPPLSQQREIAAAYRSLKAARSSAAQSSACSAGLCKKLANDLLSGRVRVPA